MKTLVIVLLLGGAGFLAYKYLYKRGPVESAATSAKFIDSCRQVSAAVAQVDAYCACLAHNGVKDMMSLATHPASRTAVATCQAQVGHVAPAPSIAPSAGQPTPTGRGRAADNMAGQLQKAYDKRRVP